MGTAKITWDPSWTNDTTIGGTIDDNDTTDIRTAEYSINDGMLIEFSVRGTYAAGTYDGPAIMHVLRRAAGVAYQERVNAHMRVPLNGGSGQSFNVVFTVGPDVNDFLLEILNQSNLQITGFLVDSKEGHIITAA